MLVYSIRARTEFFHDIMYSYRESSLEQITSLYVSRRAPDITNLCITCGVTTYVLNPMGFIKA